MNTRLKFTLAGRIVSKSRDARKIASSALKSGKLYLVDQSNNVAVLLRRAGQ